MGYKKTRLLFQTACMLLLIIFISGLTVRADNSIRVKNNFKETIVYSSYDKKEGCIFEIADLPGYDVKKVKITCNNKSVATVKNIGWGAFRVNPRKTGTTKINYSAVVNNKKIKRTGTIRTVSFQNPFRELNVNGKIIYPK